MITGLYKWLYPW